MWLRFSSAFVLGYNFLIVRLYPTALFHKGLFTPLGVWGRSTFHLGEGASGLQLIHKHHLGYGYTSPTSSASLNPCCAFGVPNCYQHLTGRGGLPSTLQLETGMQSMSGDPVPIFIQVSDENRQLQEGLEQKKKKERTIPKSSISPLFWIVTFPVCPSFLVLAH